MYKIYLSKALANILMSNQAMAAFEKSKIKDLKNNATYCIQQAVELILKYLVYTSGQYPFNSTMTNQIYDHDLDRIIRQYCDPYGIKVPAYIRSNAQLFSTWEAESRYSLSFSVRKDVIYRAIDEVSAWLVHIKPQYKAKLGENDN